MIIVVYWSHVSTRYSCQILRKTGFFDRFSNNTQISKFMSRAVPCGQTGRRTDGQTDMTKQIVTFRNFAKASKPLILITNN